MEKTIDFRQLQQLLIEIDPREVVIFINDSRITIDNWVVRQEKIYFYYKRKYLFTIDNLHNENIEYFILG